jgi:hypothetical protein
MALIIKYEEYLGIWEAMMTELRDTHSLPTRSEKNLLRNMLYYVFGEGIALEGKLAEAVSKPWDALRPMIACGLAVIDKHLDKMDYPDVVALTQPRIKTLLECVVS